ncbi:MAG: hypothetical protein ABH804_02575 [archaeon]
MQKKGVEGLKNSRCDFGCFANQKKAQVAIFIIVAIVIVGGVLLFFVFRDIFFQKGLPAEMEPIYNDFLFCLETDASIGIDILGIQGGYIIPSDFEPGTSYMPFSNHLDFFGNPIPYWYYVSGNNIQKEQVPTLKNMEKQLAEFIESRARNCNFKIYFEQGFEIIQGEPKVDVTIGKNVVDVKINMNLEIHRGEESAIIKNHGVVLNSNLGKMYESAVKIYSYEQKSLFLEEYAVDTLRLYAPVDGVEMSCAPKIWNAEEVFSELQEAVEANTLALKLKNGNYDLKSPDDKYFIVDVSVEEDVRFLNSRTWPYSFSVEPSSGAMLIASPVGNQPGLGILGFCYVPYHFVYDIKYPVLTQIFSGDEIFQFPFAVVVRGNLPREPMASEAVGAELLDLCENKNTPVTIRTYDSRLTPVETNISYECFSTMCYIGGTSYGVIDEYFPQCANGFVIARAEGYEDSEFMFSTVSPGSAEIIMGKLYELDFELKLGGREYNSDAIITFTSEKGSKTIVYPEQRKISLSQGDYEVQVYAYRNSSIRLQESVQQQCVDVPQQGFGALLGLTEKQCFDITFPSQIISNALAGGGKLNYYILESQLENSNKIEINAEELPIPVTLEHLQNNYLLFEEKRLSIYFR